MLKRGLIILTALILPFTVLACGGDKATNPNGNGGGSGVCDVDQTTLSFSGTRPPASLPYQLLTDDVTLFNVGTGTLSGKATIQLDSGQNWHFKDGTNTNYNIAAGGSRTFTIQFFVWNTTATGTHASHIVFSGGGCEQQVRLSAYIKSS